MEICRKPRRIFALFLCAALLISVFAPNGNVFAASLDSSAPAVESEVIPAEGETPPADPATPETGAPADETAPEETAPADATAPEEMQTVSATIAFAGTVTPTNVYEYVWYTLAQQTTPLASPTSFTDAEATIVKTDIAANYASRYKSISIPAEIHSPFGVGCLFCLVNEVRGSIGNNCSVTFSTVTEMSYEDLKEDLVTNSTNGADYGDNKYIYFSPCWEYDAVLDTAGIDLRTPDDEGDPRAAGDALFIDALPTSIVFPVPLKIRDNREEISFADPANRFAAIYGDRVAPGGFPDPACTIVTREPDTVSVAVSPTATDSEVLALFARDPTVYSAYGANWLTKDGAASGSAPSNNQANYYFYSGLSAKYSVSVEPITAGAQDGKPGLGGVETTTPAASYDTTLNSTNIDRGTNTDATTTDVRTAGESTAPDTTARAGNEMQDGGTRTTGFVSYGATGVSVDPNPAPGFAVDYYNVETFNPVTGASNGTVRKSPAELTAMLAAGITGKTKIYVAYATTAKFVKTDSETDTVIPGTPAAMKAAFALSAAPDFANYERFSSDANGIVTLEGLSCPTQAQTGDNVFYVKEIAAPAGYAKSDAVRTITVDHDGNVTFDTATWTDGTTDVGDATYNAFANKPSTPTIKKESPTDNKTVQKGEEITYKLTVANRESTGKSVKVLDTLPAQLDAETAVYSTEYSDGTTGVTNVPWVGALDVDIPAATVVAGQTVPGTVDITIKATVAADFDTTVSGAGAKVNILQNQASMEYTITNPENPDETGHLYTTIITNPLRPIVGYTIDKVRVEDAPAFGTTGTYGFKKGDTVTYNVTVANTGELPLTMKLTDVYETAAAGFFEDITYNVNTAEGVTWNNNAQTTTAPSITIAAEKTAAVTITANLTATAEAYLASHAADDAEDLDLKDGWLNTVTASEVKAPYNKPVYEYVLDEFGNIAVNPETGAFTCTITTEPEVLDKTTPGLIDPDGNPSLGDKSNTANTPVQPKVGYTIAKTRVTPAPQYGSTGKYGFKVGDVVSYNIVVANTGDLALTMDVSDSYALADAFKDITYAVSGTDVTWNNSTQTTTAPNVTIAAGATATVTVTATVTEKAPALLAAQAADDKTLSTDGHRNTAIAEDVTTGVLTWTPDDTPVRHPVNEENSPKDEHDTPELAPKNDTADTPVQPTLGYTMEKQRVTLAKQFGTTGNYGFAAGETVEYQSIVTNTSNVPLTLTVTDVFDGEAADYFTTLRYQVSESNGVEWLNEPSQTILDRLAALLLPESTRNASTEPAKLRIPAGKTAVVTIWAEVGTDCYLLSSAETDNGKGWKNIVTTTDVTAEVPSVDPDGEPTVTNVTKDTLPPVEPETESPLEDKSDDANTPVRPVVGYTIDKVRVEDAPAFSTTGKYGFHKGAQVTYTVTLRNTGSLALTMTLTDVYESAAASFFEDITYFVNEIDGEVEWNNKDAGADVAPNLSIAAGKTATVKITADLTDTAKAYLSDHKTDDMDDSNLADGWLNTVTASEVSATFIASNGDTVALDKTNCGVGTNPANAEDYGKSLLRDKSNTANTPVQPTIWVENTTNEYQGGTVKVESDPLGNGTASSNVSSALDGSVNNNTNRQYTYSVSGTPDPGWWTDFFKVTVGPRGQNGVSGATQIISQLPNVTTSPSGSSVSFYNTQSGEFCYVLPDGTSIEGRVGMDAATGYTRVDIVNMDRDIDIGIPFYRIPETPSETPPATPPVTAPKTGDATPLAGAAVALAASLGACVLLIRKRRPAARYRARH